MTTNRTKAVCLALIYENEIHKDANDSQRKKWKDAAIVIDGHTVGSPFVDGVDISIFNDKDKFFVASFHNCESHLLGGILGQRNME